MNSIPPTPGQVFTFPWNRVHHALESPFTFPWKPRSPSRGIRTNAGKGLSMRKINGFRTVLMFICGVGLSGASLAAPYMCPNGRFVANPPCTLCPDGSFVGGSQTCTMTPSGGFLPGPAPAQLGPDGKFHPGGGPLTMCPDGSFVTGRTCVMAPDGSFVPGR